MQLGSLREGGAILLISCYELEHQPLAFALPGAFLERAGAEPIGSQFGPIQARDAV
jgi:hypothetical protein